MATLLVVDDDTALLHLFARCLEACGHRVFIAAEGSRGHELLNAHEIDVVISDLRMPGLDGLALLAHVRALRRSVPFVLISGAWTSEERERAAALGCSRVYEKPVELAQLVRDVDELLHRPLG